MQEQKQFICMKWGTLYGAEYVNTLYAMVKRHTSGPFRFVCLTDNRDGVNPDVECHQCPIVDIPEPYRRCGWRKVSLFATADKLFNLTGSWLYLDLDVVVTGSLDEFFTFQPEKGFVVMQNWTQPGEGIGNTSVYRFRVGADSYLLDNLLERQHEIFAKYRNSQTYLSRSVKELNFWPDEWCVLFKSHCVPGWPQRLWKAPVLPETARVVAFPGVPNPHQALRGEWPAKGWKKIYKTIRPTPWIEKFWNVG
jgi:hypothetical protein